MARHTTPMNTFLVFLGAGIGGVARHGVNHWALQGLGPAFPWATFIVNVLGSLAMGLVAGWLAFRSGLAFATEAKLFLATGVLGGFTTFSAFSLDVVSLIERGEWLLAGLYVVGSVAISIGALALGLMLVRGLS